MVLYVTPLPGTTGDLRIAGLTRLWYIYCTYCAVYLQMSTLYCAHNTLTHRDTHVSDLQILDITVAHHCARVSRGRKEGGVPWGALCSPIDILYSYVQYVLCSTIFRTYIQL